MKKNPALQDSPPAAGRVSDILPFRRSAILAERFYRIRRCKTASPFQKVNMLQVLITAEDLQQPEPYRIRCLRILQSS